MMGEILKRTIFGAISGLFAWAICEPSAPKVFGDAGWERWELIFISLLSGLIGTGLGMYPGLSSGSVPKALRGAGVGAFLGLLFGNLGHGFGGSLVSAIAPHREVTGFLRIIALTPLGAAIGLAVGISTFEPKRILQGLYGGALGGLAGAALFDIIGPMTGSVILIARGQSTGEAGMFSRAAYTILVGGAIGLFIALIERMGQKAFVRQVLGRNEGKLFPVDLPETRIGKDEMAQIPIFGDPSVQRHHASIFKLSDAQYVLRAVQGQVIANGQPIQETPLAHGMQFLIGSNTFIFEMKQVAATQPAMVQQYAAPMPYLPEGPMAPVAYAPTSQPTVVFAPHQPGGWILVATDGPLAGNRFPIAAPTEVGRDLPVIPFASDGGVSRRHARLEPAPSGVAVQDLGSTNGTFVNGQRVQNALLAPGGQLKIGMTTFRLEGG
ncbi:MAG: FHA domain-containing protein [Armatimonadetes bacterium]|nr:FHA domain-containing protein [Armatimonadota bacterium]